MILSDITIFQRGKNLLDPFNRGMVQPASVDLTLDHRMLKPVSGYDGPFGRGPIDPFNPDDIEYLEIDLWSDGYDDGYFILPHDFLLGSTQEKVIIPHDIVGRIEGKSSLARLGLFVHITAGFIDPGFEGTITLELYNANPRAIKLTEGMKICQVAFEQLTTICGRPYGSEDLGSHYQGQTEVTGSRYEQEVGMENDN